MWGRIAIRTEWAAPSVIFVMLAISSGCGSSSNKGAITVPVKPAGTPTSGGAKQQDGGSGVGSGDCKTKASCPTVTIEFESVSMEKQGEVLIGHPNVATDWRFAARVKDGEGPRDLVVKLFKYPADATVDATGPQAKLTWVPQFEVKNKPEDPLVVQARDMTRCLVSENETICNDYTKRYPAYDQTTQVSWSIENSSTGLTGTGSTSTTTGTTTTSTGTTTTSTGTTSTSGSGSMLSGLISSFLGMMGGSGGGGLGNIGSLLGNLGGSTTGSTGSTSSSSSSTSGPTSSGSTIDPTGGSCPPGSSS